MKGISKETLSELFNKFYDDEFMSVDQLETLLIEACEELDPWLPIADAPKDRELLLYDNGNHIGIFDYFDGIIAACWVDRSGRKLLPTHYKELPPDPKD